jgi:hypothetical protein
MQGEHAESMETCAQIEYVDLNEEFQRCTEVKKFRPMALEEVN